MPSQQTQSAARAGSRQEIAALIADLRASAVLSVEALRLRVPEPSAEALAEVQGKLSRLQPGHRVSARIQEVIAELEASSTPGSGEDPTLRLAEQMGDAYPEDPRIQHLIRDIREARAQGDSPGLGEAIDTLAGAFVSARREEVERLQSYATEVDRQLQALDRLVDTIHCDQSAESSEAEAESAAQERALESFTETIENADDLATLQASVRETVESLRGELRELQQRRAERREAAAQSSGQASDEIRRLREELNERIREVQTDALTGVGSRRGFEERYYVQFQAERVPKIALALLDIDHFKTFNDTYGHAVGDAVLSAFAAELARRLPESAYLARWGGEEFAVLMPASSVNETARVLREIHRAVSAKALVRHEGEALAITFSVGISLAEAEDTAESLFERTDAALYAVKNQGRNGLANLQSRQREPVLLYRCDTVSVCSASA